MELTHPGELLRMEIVEGRDLTIAKAAELLDVTRPTLSNILNGKAAITPNIALRVETVFGGAARFWVRMQSSYDLSIAKKGFMENPPKITRYKLA
ncbi:addiction module HigA family antidote [Pedobacter sp. CG_S7]|uniref:HigA family addiction module antitoxin n=1 Tax=Pedobacter sp. CG_S7 TaxID=3143930 RepID=UPI0033944FE3